ncbi:hypothetical protein BO70DRAFT_399422 [Aspergillus heteromorphus CBS 117.55]|uniref:Methyltransferase type 11 domain-containing protein n=1 Tax=Aspergillus heteromorphus CBS 117.55 TaxID=1448321 RepID=A0A317VFJ2_9EURO|nr:uncharacterized protein BO70DRAFT_399422 [Aspergillus heteromorphus CBS 117.55]PWY71728.1 hypothetical protein BO70DRAFT_399422 [Aspergillus heteromorphus CBS 117.55]
MSSHKSDGGRIPRLKDVASQSRIVSSPAMNSARPSDSSAEMLSRPQIPRSTNFFAKSTRASSMSNAEESRHNVARSIPSRIPAGQHVRPSIPPRATTHPLPPKSLHLTPDQSAHQTFHMAVEPLSAPEIATQNPAPSRPRNVLRRKAPTIGQYTAKNKPSPDRIRPEKLNVVIPDNPPIGHSGSGFFKSHASETDLAKRLASPMASQDNISSIVQDHQGHTGPKELASLRTTTINTQNLPPPTPLIPSASSPSTRYSDSPGVWSRTSTPTTLSSYSPGIVHPVKVPRLRQASPSQSRLPVFSHQAQQMSASSGREVPVPTKSPLLASSTSSRTSIVENEAMQPVSKSSMSSLINTSNSHLPRKASTSSVANSSRKENAKHDANVKAENRVSGFVSHRPRDVSMTRSVVQAPPRPTREGTHQLVLEPSPVVQSNISPKAVTGHKRRGSADKSPIAERISNWNRSAATSVDSLHSRASSNITPRIPTSPDLSRKLPRISTTEVKPQQDIASPGKSRAFGLFTKRSKPEMDDRSEGRLARKGPVAGTGHEGYGRYAQRGRKSSVSSNTSRGRSTSTTRSGPKSVGSSKSSKSSRPELDLDDFLLDRLEPVIIRGGDMDGRPFARRPSEQSTSGISTASTSNLTVQSKISESPGCSTETLASSRASADPGESIVKNLGRQETLEKPAIANTRPENDPKRVQATASRSIQGLHQANLDIRSTRPIPSSDVQSSQKQAKRGLGIKWNIFQRKQPTDKSNAQVSTPPAPKLHATVSRTVAHRSVAHYAMIDIDSDPLEEIVHTVEKSPPTEDEDPSSPVQVPPALNIKKATESILLPSPPMLHDALFKDQPQSPKVYFDKKLVPQSPETKVEEERPSRLASVGRIPRVVSRRERPHKPALQSFSRPFSVAQSPSMPAPVVDKPGDLSFSPIFTPDSRYDSPSKPRDYKFDLTNPFKDPLKGSVLDFIAGPYSKEEFMSFFPRKDSIMSTSSGSDSLAAVTAVIPEPLSQLTEDEIWGEYDDLIDHVLSPQTTSTVFESESDGDHKLELATMASRTLQAELNGQQAQSTLEKPAVEFTPSSPHSSTGSVRLRRSKIAPELHTSLTLSSQPSYSEIIASYCDDRSETGTVEKEAENKSLAPNPVVEQPSGLLSSTALVSSPSFEICRQRNTVLFDIAERDREGPTAHTNIRSGSLMTSRWLSFGRVLFSPAHNHAKGADQERILVVDGLGNDDWSFYCSLTYPNAQVYSLSDGPKPTASKHPEAWQPPSNHHTIHHASLNDPLPFPRAFFAATVLRFPAACSDRAQDNIISECKRVLRSGGYLEMSILDLDMVNMGIRTRKAVRKLKERTYISDPHISLKPTSDSIQRLLGRHGFDNLRRCMVRIPVAGMIVRTSASSTSTTSSSSNPSATVLSPPSSTPFSPLTGLAAAAKAKAKAHGKSSSSDTDLSLGDLLSDPSSNDESIRKIVAKVGRWWYTRCYELPVLPNGDVALSIWSERRILRECQHRGTGFRLWIAYAQKPSEKRRTASV